VGSTNIVNSSKPKKLAIFTLRNQIELSGEANTQLAFVKFVSDGGVVLIGHDEALQGRLVQLLSRASRLIKLILISWGNVPEILVVKIPTASQLGLVSLLTFGYRGRLIIWVDGLMWYPPPAKLLVQLLIREPVLTLARMIFNLPYWLKAVRTTRFEIVVSSEFQREQITKVRKNAWRISVIPNSTHFDVRNGKGMPVKDLTKPVFGYIGHAFYTKGIYDFVDSLEILSKRCSNFDAKFALSGLGSGRARQRIKSIGFFVQGKVIHEEFFESIDCIVLPYWVDWGTNVFPSVILEALYFGVPVISTEHRTIRELFGKDDNLYISVKTNDAVALADKLYEVAHNMELLPRAERLKMLYEEKYAHDVIKQQWVTLLQKNG